LSRSRDRTIRIIAIAVGCVLAVAALLAYLLVYGLGKGKKQYWATSLSRTVDAGVLQGLYEAVARGEVGWLDVDPKFPLPSLEGGINLILYHVGGNCYIGADCERFPASEPTGDQWGGSERQINLNDPAVRKIVVADLVEIVRQGDRSAPPGAIVGVHLDNVHRLKADGLAAMFNDYLRAVAAAKRDGRIAQGRVVGYIAKNNPDAFQEALDRELFLAAPLYQINENATLDRSGKLDEDSRIAQRIGRRYGIPVFLKTFGSDVAYRTDQGEGRIDVYVSQAMTRQMAQLRSIAGAAWSPNEREYRPTLFAQGGPVRPVWFPYRARLAE